MAAAAVSRKPMIAVNGDFRPSRKDAVALSWFNTGCYDSISAVKGIPLLIPPLADDADLRALLNQGLRCAGPTCP